MAVRATIEEASVGFPWEKVRAAQQYLIALKPYWSRFSSRVKIIPMYTAPESGQKYGGLTSTTPDLNVFIDRGFASKAPLEELAAAIEHEYLHHAADTWNRLAAQEEVARMRYLNIVTDLEINRQITESYKDMDYDSIISVLNTSKHFNTSEMAKWLVNGPPRLPSGTWDGEQCGMPGEMTAEEYFDKLYQPIPPSDAPDSTNGDTEDKGEDDEESDTSDQDNPSGDKSGQGKTADEKDDTDTSQGQSSSSSANDKGEDSDHNDEDSAQEDAEGDTEGDEGDSESSSQNESQESGDDSDDGGDSGTEDEGSGSSGDSGEEDSSATSGSGSGGDDDSQSSDSGGVSTGDEDSQQAGSEDENPESGGGETNDQQGSGGGSGSGSGGSPGGGGEDSQGDSEEPLSQKTPADIIEELRNDPAKQWWSEDMGKQEDGDEANWKPSDYNRKTLASARMEKQDALEILSEDVIDNMTRSRSGGAGFSLEPGRMLIDMAKSNAVSVRSEIEVESILQQLIINNVTGAAVKGQSDLTYAARNPNQPMFGPILRGQQAFAPNVYFVLDVSYSMIPYIKRYMGVFQDIAMGVLSKFNTSVTWVTVDTAIQQVGTDFTMTEDMVEKWGMMGFGGTDIGSVLEEIIETGITWENKVYPKSDVIFFATDCEFAWPWRESDYKPFPSEIVVASPHKIAKSKRFGLPKWFIDGQNFVSLPARPPAIFDSI